MAAEELDKAVIGTIGKAEKPVPPGKKGYISFKRQLYGITDRIRQQRRDVVLSMTPEDLSAAAADLCESYTRGASVVFSGRQIIDAELGKMPELEKNITEISL